MFFNDFFYIFLDLTVENFSLFKEKCIYFNCSFSKAIQKRARKQSSKTLQEDVLSNLAGSSKLSPYAGSKKNPSIRDHECDLSAGSIQKSPLAGSLNMNPSTSAVHSLKCLTVPAINNLDRLRIT